jgi:deoxyribose-phosphate aldolase
MTYTPTQIADALDFAILNPAASDADIQSGCEFANEHNLKSVCVYPQHVKFTARFHANVSAVISFPHGTASPLLKYREAVQAINDGARELDVVVNWQQFIGGDVSVLQKDLRCIREVVRTPGVIVKAILETCWYTPAQLIDACKRCADEGCDFIKTSTGHHEGATVEAVETIMDAVGDRVQVKASGGIKTYEDASKFLDLGCTRLGASRYLELLPCQ